MLAIKEEITFQDFYQVLFEHKKISWDSSIQNRVEESFTFLQNFAQDKIIYGVNTGFGPMAQYQIEKQDLTALQYNLIRSHASGTGKIMQSLYVKSLMLARLNTLSLGKSGVHQSVIKVMTQLLNKEITPLIFEHGGVGASGDLVQLAHLALVLIGEGEVFYKGKRCNTQEVFKQEGINPIQVKGREGLGLMNGTSAMTGIGIVNTIYAKRLLNWSVFASSLINELVEAYDDHFSEQLNAAKKHRGQQEIAALMRDHLKDSDRIKSRVQHLYNPKEEKVFKEKVQEYYSLRCVPQILGPIRDTIRNTESILMEEVNSANDNPIVDVASQQIYHGGNFHGDYVALEMDKLKLSITKLSMLAERQLNYLLNAKLNELFPPFMNLGTLGLNFGVQGMQFTAVSTTAENQALSNSMYIHSIPNNNDNQDVVSMGTNAANMTKTVIDNAYEVVAIQLIALTQAVYFSEEKKKFSTASGSILQQLKKLIPPFKMDEPIYPYIKKVKEFLLKNDAYQDKQ
ncbi:aromatic amino acid ammonia-lyase [Mesonia ostreae]|uniref:Aromatic amino acid ammonia-lyase n=1 Tax=Mesonia ostreae TaxID=861110 RepID=A0ABU2KI80_9FLAO|nr:aromatic amino acid ammonia-lyase [Mesonia ostreae]MDT0294389.1 aromatic amino acid ammonia-lyase [Mesonia ostreae]